MLGASPQLELLPDLSDAEIKELDMSGIGDLNRTCQTQSSSREKLANRAH